jgi:glycosyltransferase involved in cell wall biosynthesis
VIQRALESVLSQTKTPYEVLVIDDGSTDQTGEILKRYPEVRYFYQKNKGVSHARNFGIEKAKGEWIAFLDSDDEWKKRKLEKQINYALLNPEIDLIHCNEKWIRNGEHLNQKKIHRKSGGDLFERCLELCLISPSAVMIKRELLLENLFKEDFVVCEDYDLWLRLTHFKEVGFIEDSLVIKYGGQKDQLSQKFKAMDLWRVRSIYDLLLKNLLSKEKETQALSTLERKCRILIQGYKKHQNFQNLREVEDIMSFAQSKKKE